MAGQVFHQCLPDALLWDARDRVDSHAYLRTKLVQTRRTPQEPGVAYFPRAELAVAHWRLQDTYIFQGAPPERGDGDVAALLERVLAAHFDAVPLAVVAAHAPDYAADSLEAAVLAAREYGTVRVRPVATLVGTVEAVEAATYHGEVDLLEGVGVTVLPGPQVFWPPAMVVMWLPGSHVCFVGNPDTGAKLPHAHHGTPYILCEHTALMFQ